jgi:TonB-dependent receptor-like protein/carboxypeptidase family protein
MKRSPSVSLRLRAGLAFAILCAPLAGALDLAAGAGLAGRVVDASSAGLPGVSVEARRAGDPASAAVRATTDRAGAWEIAGLQAAEYEISFTLPGFARATRKAAASSSAASADPIQVLLDLSATADVLVRARRVPRSLADVEDPDEGLAGTASSASDGAISGRRIAERPLLRPADVLESVPGLAVGQHSGEGKANQYFTRGFDLDHGTDFATSIAGMPVNMPSHAHGQGYSDLNFLIPELVSGVQYRKGLYAADQGDFATAGAASISYKTVLEKSLASVGGGAGSWGRALFADSSRLGAGTFLYALEAVRNDGPWTNPDRMRKYNGVVSWTLSGERSAFTVTAMGYRNGWSSTDQVPERAVDAGTVSRFGAVDPTDGGETHRYSLSADWQSRDESGVTRVAAYAIDYRLNLFSNFTYFLADPVLGDQFEQTDRRLVTGVSASRQWVSQIFGMDAESTAGFQLRNDAVAEDGLFHTRARRVLSVTRLDRVDQASGGIYGQTTVRLLPRLRAILGLRGDVYRFRVSSDDAANSGGETSAIWSPKLSFVLGPWSSTEVYANYGWGFHSNDARAAVGVASAGEAAPGPATPLVRAKGAEVGLRTSLTSHVQTTIAVWTLDLASELVYGGDSGTTEPSRASRRAGVEWANVFRPIPGLAIDADVSFSKARFRGNDPAGNRVPGSVEAVLSGGIAVDPHGGPFGSVRVRYFGPRALVEDNSVRSHSSTLVHAQAGWEIAPGARVILDVFNVLDAKAGDAEYFYASRLSGEPPGGTEGIHVHPAEPRTARLSLSCAF